MRQICPTLSRRRRDRTAIPLLLVLAMVGGTPIAGQTPPVSPLTLDSAIDLALVNNPIYLQQETNLGVARSAVRSAYGSLTPTANLGVGFGYTAPGELRYQSEGLGNRPDYYSSDYSFRLSYQLSGSTLLRPGLERSRMRATERRLYGAQAQLASDVTRQYLLALQERERLAQAEREVGRTGEHVRLAEARLEVGAGTPLDVRRAEVQQGQAEVQLVQAENTASMEVLRLSQLLGMALPLDIELVSSFAIFDPTWSVDQLVARALVNNPNLLSARASATAADVSTKAARSQYLPSVSLSAGVAGSVYQAGNVDPLVRDRIGQLQGGYGACVSQNEIRTSLGLPPTVCLDPSDPAVRESVRSSIAEQNRGFPFGYTGQPLQASVSISLPVLTGYNRQHQVNLARAAAADAHFQVRAEELRLRQEVATAVLGLDAAYRTALLQESVRDSAAEELLLATERFRFGATTSIEVTDAQTHLAQAEIDQIEAVYTFHRSLASLEALVGETLR